MADEANTIVLQMRQMARHMAWADATVWSAVLTAPSAAGDAKIADTLHHIHQVQHIFLQAWTRAQFNVRERKEFATLDEIATWGLEARRGVLSFMEQVSAGELAQEMRMPWAAFFGVMGTAPPPAWGALSTAPPRKNGGNLDNKELVAGTTLYLPIFVEGALFSAGDGHGAQGDGEVSVNAVETGLTGTFRLTVRDDMRLEWPMAETPTHMITIKPLFNAA